MISFATSIMILLLVFVGCFPFYIVGTMLRYVGLRMWLQHEEPGLFRIILRASAWPMLLGAPMLVLLIPFATHFLTDALGANRIFDGGIDTVSAFFLIMTWAFMTTGKELSYLKETRPSIFSDNLIVITGEEPDCSFEGFAFVSWMIFFIAVNLTCSVGINKLHVRGLFYILFSLILIAVSVLLWRRSSDNKT